MLEVGEGRAHAHLFPFRIVAYRPRPPPVEALPGEVPETVHTLRVQHILLGLVDALLEVDSQAHHFISRCLKDGMFAIVACINACYKATWRQVETPIR